MSLRVVSEKPDSEQDHPAFLRVRHIVLTATLPDGSVSEPFSYDTIERRAVDAVVVAAHFRHADGRRFVYLRSALRPPVALRSREASPLPERPTLGGLWEVVAGLVEADERSAAGLVSCAARELYEELGARVSEVEIRPLGPATFPSPGIIGERHYYFHVEVLPASLVAPTEDGSVLERQASIITVPLDEALALLRAGEIEDAKTEIALRRLAEVG